MRIIYFHEKVLKLQIMKHPILNIPNRSHLGNQKFNKSLLASNMIYSHLTKYGMNSS